MKTLKEILCTEHDTGSDLGLTVTKVKKNKYKEIVDYTLGITIDSDKGLKLMKGGKWAAVANKLVNLIGKDIIKTDIIQNPDIDTLIWFELMGDDNKYWIEYSGKKIDLPANAL